MQLTRKQIVGGIVGVVVVATLAFGGWLLLRNIFDPYHGLTTHMDIAMDDATRTTIEQRLQVSFASLEALERKGEEIDLDLYMVIAEDSLFLGDLVTAREYYQLVLDDNPINPVAWNNFGYVAEMMSDYDVAEEAYQHAIENGSSTEEYYRDLVTFLEVHYPDRSADIKSLLESQIATMGQTPWNMVTLAKWYEAHGDCERAEAHYKVAVTLDPENEGLKDDYNEVRTECK